MVKEECRVVARACALSLVNEGEGGPNSAFCQIASNCDPPFFNERLDLMIEGKSRGDLEIYRTNLMEKGLSVDAIAQDQFLVTTTSSWPMALQSIPATQESYQSRVRCASSADSFARFVGLL